MLKMSGIVSRRHGPRRSRTRAIVLLMLMSTLISTASCARLLATVSQSLGVKAGAKVAIGLPGPKAQTVVKKEGGTFCATTAAVGWPLVITPEAAIGLKALPRPMKTTIKDTQKFGIGTCQNWKTPGG